MKNIYSTQKMNSIEDGIEFELPEHICEEILNTYNDKSPRLKDLCRYYSR